MAAIALPAITLEDMGNLSSKTKMHTHKVSRSSTVLTNIENNVNGHMGKTWLNNPFGLTTGWSTI